MVHTFCISISFVLFIPSIYGKLETLDDFLRHAATLPENTPWSGDWGDPDFEDVFLKQSPDVFRRVFDSLGISSLTWSILDLEDALRTYLSRNSKYKEVYDLAVDQQSKLVVWGDLHGAYHSFLRDLKELESRGIIDKKLRFAPGYKGIIIGDVASRSPYVLQQLTLILRLFEQNPGAFLMLGTAEERNGNWKNFLAMRQPLVIYTKAWWESLLKKTSPNTVLPLEQPLTQFFNSLPLVVALTYGDGAAGRIYCGEKKIGMEYLKPKSSSALITGDIEASSAYSHAGLNLLGYNYGATCWSLISSPIQVHQQHLNFYFDSFFLLSIGADIRKTYITHFFRDCRTRDPFKVEYADVFTGIVRNALADLAVIQAMPIFNFGSMLALFGGYGSAGVPLKQGIEAAVIEVNNKGGVNGYLLYPVIFDDEYTGRLAAFYARKLTDEYGVDIFICPQGTPTLRAYIDRVKRGEIAVLFPRSGATQFYDRSLKYLINDLAPVDDEVHALMDQMVNEFKIRHFSFIYPVDDFGLPFMDTVRRELKGYGITSTLDVPYEHGQTDFTDQIKKLRESTDEGVGIFITSNAPIREFLSGLGMEFFLSKAVFMTSFLDTLPFNQFVTERGISFTMSYPVPDPRAVDLPIFHDCKQAIKSYGLSYNASLFEGYLAVKLFIDALAHLKPPFTKEAVIGYFEGLKNYSFGGLNLSFRPEFRDLNMPVFIMTSERRWVAYKDRRRVAEGEFIS